MKKRSRELATPDITPLIDVVFLLLIFFMVSTVFKKDELALLLNLPKTTSGDQKSVQKENLIIELTEKEVAINGEKFSLESVSEKLAKVTNKQIPVELRIDKKVQYDRVVILLDKLKKNQLSNLSLITDS